MVTIKKLNCGTTVIMEKSERVQSAALGIWVRAGASDEWDEVSGVSHFIEHMMFKGTKNRTAKQIAEDVDKIGGVFNAFTVRRRLAITSRRCHRTSAEAQKFCSIC